MANDRDGRRLYKELNAIGLGPGFGGSKTQTAKKNLDELHTKVDVWGKDIDDFVEKQHVHVENEEKLKECGEKLMIEKDKITVGLDKCETQIQELNDGAKIKNDKLEGQKTGGTELLDNETTASATISEGHLDPGLDDVLKALVKQGVTLEKFVDAYKAYAKTNAVNNTPATVNGGNTGGGLPFGSSELTVGVGLGEGGPLIAKGVETAKDKQDVKTVHGVSGFKGGFEGGSGSRNQVQVSNLGSVDGKKPAADVGGEIRTFNPPSGPKAERISMDTEYDSDKKRKVPQEFEDGHEHGPKRRSYNRKPVSTHCWVDGKRCDHAARCAVCMSDGTRCVRKECLNGLACANPGCIFIHTDHWNPEDTEWTVEKGRMPAGRKAFPRYMNRL